MHWSYAGEGGPQAWHRLKPEFAKCGIGTRQSPIDIRDALEVKMESIRFDYRPSGFRVIDNGHTVQVNLAPGNFIEVAGRRFALRQFHFHRPSEERVYGRQFDMDVHLVHEDEQGRAAVVAVLVERGAAHPVVQAVWNSLPLEKHEEQRGPGELDLQQLLPADRGYYMYMGSFTTPPCSEGVLWLVLKQAVALSDEQVAIFERLYPMNARPVQPSGGRLIKATD
jgi:carbonic anhydrase